MRNKIAFEMTEEGLKQMAIFLAELVRQSIVFVTDTSLTNGTIEVELTGF